VRTVGQIRSTDLWAFARLRAAPEHLTTTFGRSPEYLSAGELEGSLPDGALLAPSLFAVPGVQLPVIP